MKSEKVLVINREIYILKDGEDYLHKTIIQEIQDKFFIVAVPDVNDSPVEFRQGEKVKVVLTGEDTRFTFATTVLGRQLSEVPLYLLSLPKQVNRVQDREYVRLPVAISMYFALPSTSRKVAPLYYGITRNLSEGGVMLVSDQSFDVGTILDLKFSLPGNKGQDTEFLAQGRVARTDYHEWESEKKFQMALEFVGLSRHQRDQIFRYIFSKMVDQRRLRY